MATRWTLAAALTAGLLAQGCGPSGEDAAAPGAVTIKLTCLAYLSYAPFVIARQEGYFAEQDLDVEFVSLKRSSYGIPALAQGELDVLAGAISAGLCNAIARGAPIRIVADRGYIGKGPSAYAALLVRRPLVEQGPLNDPSRLRGLRVVCARDSSMAYVVEKAFNRFGLGLDDVTLSYVPMAARLAAMEKGTADIVDATEPWVTRLLMAGHAVLWADAYEVVPDFQLSYVAFGPSLLEKRPDAGRRFMVAYLKAVRQYNQGKTERNLQILAEHMGLEEDILAAAAWPPFRDGGRINVQSVLDFQAWAAGRGLIDRPLKPEEFWDPRFVDHATAVLEAAPDQQG